MATTSPLTFGGVPLVAGASQGTGNRSTTTTTPDPFQQFLNNFILNKIQSPQAQVSPTVSAGIERGITNPGVTPDQFSAIAAPLVAQARQTEQIEQRDLQDLFRKSGAGSLQSGAFADSSRRLIGDQATRRQSLLANTFVPLTNQLTQAQLQAIQLGLQQPEAATSSLRFPTTLSAALQPRQTSSEGISIGPNTRQSISGGSVAPPSGLQTTLDFARLQKELASIRGFG